MTPSVMQFIAKAGPQGRVLEIGSYNVNGTARDAFEHGEWVGVDFREGPGVDLVCDGANLPFRDGEFSCVVIAETLEHCEKWRDVLAEGWRCLKNDGVMVVTTPAPGFPRHDYPSDYWRFTALDWWGMFRANDILALAEWDAGPGSGAIVRKKTERLNLDAVEPARVAPAGRVVIGTAMYEGKNWSSYTHCLVRDFSALKLSGVNVAFDTIEGDSYIARAKNTLANRFLENPENAALIMIDWDHWWDPGIIEKLLSTPEEIVGCDYPMKNSIVDGTFCAHFVLDKETREHTGKLREGRAPLIEAELIPGGFMRIRRSALEKFKAAYPEKRYHDPSADQGSPNAGREYTSFFEQNFKTGGEDMTFCRNWRAIGGQLWIEPDATIGHWWANMHSGNLDLHLRDLKKMQDAGFDTDKLLEMARQAA